MTAGKVHGFFPGVRCGALRMKTFVATPPWCTCLCVCLCKLRKMGSVKKLDSERTMVTAAKIVFFTRIHKGDNDFGFSR